MNIQVLLELVAKWECKSLPSGEDVECPEAEVINAVARGERETYRQCAEELNLLIKLLGR